MQTAYAQIGIELPRTTYEQFGVGVVVPPPSLSQPGDLIFVPGTDGTSAAPGHVGLYIGDGDILQAPQTGDHVKITALSDWLGSVAAIRRVV